MTDINLVQSMVETLLFYHPAVWWVSRRIRAEREHCCDDWAVEVCGDRLIYARALAALEDQRSEGWLLAPSAGDGSLLDRVRRLLGVARSDERPASGLAGAPALAMVALLGVVFLLAPAANQARAGVEARDPIIGSVVTPDGKLVAGADVWLVAHWMPENKAVTLVRSQTDGQGRFRLVADEEKRKVNVSGRAIWAHKPGLRLGVISSRDKSRPHGFDPGRPIKLTLEASASGTFRILDPANKPIAGARVTLTGLDDGFTAPPGDLLDRLAARTGPDGRAVLVGAPLNRIRGVRIKADSFGAQNFYAHFGFRADEPLRLRAAVPVDGRVIADDPAAVRGLTLYFSASPDEARDMTKLIPQGEALAVTDSHGRFHIPALATGKLLAWVQMPEESLYRAPQMENLEISSDKRAEIVIPLKRMVHVRGVVREKGSGKPVPNVGIIFGSRELAELLPMAVTDGEGRYEAIAPPGANSQFHLSGPTLYLSPLQGFVNSSRGITLAIGPADGQVLPPIELNRGVTLRGIVVDEEGKAVDEANVEGKWEKAYSVHSPDPGGPTGFMTRSLAMAKTDARGEFVLEGIDPGANVMLEASAGDARTDRPTQAAAGTATAARLVISGANTVALIGRAVNAVDKPVVGAAVHIRSRPLRNDGHPEPGTVHFDGAEIRTDADGRFRTPRQLKRGYGYRAEIKPVDEAFMPESTPWLALKTDTRPFFPKMVLRGLRTVRGRVIDSQGRPLAGAAVRQAGDGPALTQDITDSEGRFALLGVLAEPAFVFVAKDGYRFAGKPIKANDAFVEVTLIRADESFPKRLLSLAPPLARVDELAIIHSVFDGYAERVIKDGTSHELVEVLRILVWLDPGRAIELQNDRRLQPWQLNNIRLTLATQLVRQDDKEARGLIEAIQDTSMRSYAYSEASAALADTERVRKLELLNESLVAGRAVVDPEARVLRLADIGGRLFDMGQTEEATNLLREAQATAVKLRAAGTGTWGRGRLAEELAQVDLPAALGLLEGTEQERDHDQYLGRIAHELAARNPAEAERVLMMMRDVWPHFRDEYTQKVCYRMVTIDRERALALVAGMKTPRHRARALGAMALALEKTKGDHATALRLLDQAFQVLDQAVTSGTDDWDGLGMACTAAAGLLPIVEQVDPRLLGESIWRMLALRPPIPGQNGRDTISDIASARVAAMAARYDRAVSRQLFNGFAGRALALRIGLDDWGSMFKGEEVFEAAAIVDPARAAALIDSLPESSGLSSQELKNGARLTVARILARPGDERWHYLERNQLHLWPIDSEED